jgi:hypothetical protein
MTKERTQKYEERLTDISKTECKENEKEKCKSCGIL